MIAELLLVEGGEGGPARRAPAPGSASMVALIVPWSWILGGCCWSEAPAWDRLEEEAGTETAGEEVSDPGGESMAETGPAEGSGQMYRKYL
jgi:hypothetical protein